MKLVYNKNLEGLRGIAALIVVFSHASNYFIKRNDVQIALENLNLYNLRENILIALFNCGQGAGQVGVMIFFALSGFLLVSQFCAENPQDIDFKTYYWKRIIRIIPFYYLILFSSMLIEQYTSLIVFDVKLNEFIFHILFIQGNSVLWTIGPELLSYLFIPLTILLYLRMRSYLLLGYVAAFVVGFYTQIAALLIINYFLLGQFLALYLNEKPVRQLDRGNALSLLLLLLIFISFPLAKSLYSPDQTSGWGSVQLFLIIGAMLYMSVKFERTIFSFGILCHFGKISFSLYLTHIFVLNYLKNFVSDQSSILMFALGVFVSYGLAVTCFVCVEKPITYHLRKKLYA